MNTDPPAQPEPPSSTLPPRMPLPPEPAAPASALPFLTPLPRGAGLGAVIEALLKNPGSAIHEFTTGTRKAILVRSLMLILIAGMALFGLAAADYTQGIQWWAAPLKLVGGLCLAALLCVPSLYIFSCLSGLEIRFQATAGLLLSSLALTCLLLAGFTPVMWIFSQSTSSLPFMGFLMLTVWAISLSFGLKFLFSGARALGIRSTLHLRLWTGIFILVTLQMSCALRPLLGQAPTFLPTEKKFFMQHWGQHLGL